jgi:hypothetical protein
MKQFTLVSFYGPKERGFARLIRHCQEAATKKLGSAFQPYDLSQVHATIIGLERFGPDFHNANFQRWRRRRVIMDIDGFVRYLRGGRHFPIRIQVGGFAAREYPFRSRGLTPYERSFSRQADSLVVIGWPAKKQTRRRTASAPGRLLQEKDLYPPTLDLIRREAQRFGILHAHHRTTADQDNDLYFRVGLIDSKRVDPAEIGELERQMRQELSRRPPLVMELTLADLSIVAYKDRTLPNQPIPTPSWPITGTTVTEDYLRSLCTHDQ